MTIENTSYPQIPFPDARLFGLSSVIAVVVLVTSLFCFRSTERTFADVI